MNISLHELTLVMAWETLHTEDKAWRLGRLTGDPRDAKSTETSLLSL